MCTTPIQINMISSDTSHRQTEENAEKAFEMGSEIKKLWSY